MKILRSKRAIVLTVIVFIALSIGLPICSFIVEIALFGYVGEGPLYADVLFRVAWAPNILFKMPPFIYDESGRLLVRMEKVHIFNIAANCLGYGLVGFIIGLIISAAKGRRRKIRP